MIPCRLDSSARSANLSEKRTRTVVSERNAFLSRNRNEKTKISTENCKTEQFREHTERKKHQNQWIAQRKFHLTGGGLPASGVGHSDREGAMRLFDRVEIFGEHRQVVTIDTFE